MLTAEEKQKIEHEIEHVPVRKAACIEALKIVCNQRGWVSDENVKDIADYLEMSVEEVDSVATFYNLIFRRPVGRNVILVCDSISCWIMGYENLKNKLSEKLGIKYGETTADGRFTLLPNPCLGTCDHAPAMMVGNDLFRDIETSQLDQILDKYK